MIGTLLKHWRAAAGLALAAGLWLHGAQTGAARVEARHTAAAAAARAAADTRRAETGAAEILRLADQAGLDFILGEVTHDARNDPDAGAVSLGLRDAARLNRIR